MRTVSLLQDWKRNSGNFKGRFVLLNFRLAALIQSHPVLRIVFFWYLAYYRVFVIWILGVELPPSLQIGAGLQLFHGQALVVNPGTVIGVNCVLRHSTTIGNKRVENGFSQCPRIGDNVDIGSNTCILGDISIGANVVIGAGSVVVKSVSPNCVVVGNPAKIIRQMPELKVLNRLQPV